MRLAQKKNAFIQLGKALSGIEPALFEKISHQASLENHWFTPENIRLTLEAISHSLQEEKLNHWISLYPELEREERASKKVGVIMAGNIPAVGFQDFIAVLLSGHILLAKLSAQDTALMKYMAEQLTSIEPAFKEYIHFVERLNDAEAVIATGSDNSARYFEYYFSKVPHIIRRNRNGLAVLWGDEEKEDFQKLGQDIFQYFGLGCRSVSKIYVPEGYDFSPFLGSLDPWKPLMMLSKYANNYDYQRSILLVNQAYHLDTGFLLLRENEAMASPVSLLNFAYYDHLKNLEEELKPLKDKIQCIVSKEAFFPGSIPLGTAQSPELWDYADGVDTMKFLLPL